jgi:hypothetical protein
MIYAEAEVSGALAEFYVNGIPSWRRIGRPGERFASVPVHQHLVDGSNEIELLIEPGPTPSSARVPREPHRAAGIEAFVRLVRYPVDVYPGDASGEVLAEARFRGEEGRDEPFPYVLRAEADLGPLFGRWAWQDADPIAITATVRNEVEELVRRVHEAFAAGDPMPIVMLCDLCFAEGSRAYPARSAEALASGFAESLRESAQQPDWEMVPLDPERFDFRLCAGGRMIECIDRDWQPTVRSRPQADGDFPFPMFLSRIGRELVIVR